MKIHMRTTDEMCTKKKLARNLEACVLAIPAVRSSNPLLVKPHDVDPGAASFLTLESSLSSEHLSLFH